MRLAYPLGAPHRARGKIIGRRPQLPRARRRAGQRRPRRSRSSSSSRRRRIVRLGRADRAAARQTGASTSRASSASSSASAAAACPGQDAMALRRRLHHRQRRHRARPAEEGRAVHPRQGLRQLLPVRPGLVDRRRPDASCASSPALDGVVKQDAPHERHDLRHPDDHRGRLARDDARAGRPHRHRHAAGRRRRSCPATSSRSTIEGIGTLVQSRRGGIENEFHARAAHQGASAVSVRRHRQEEGGAARAGQGSHRPRHRRSRPADAGAHRRGDAEGGRRAALPSLSVVRGHEGVSRGGGRLVRAALRRARSTRQASAARSSARKRASRTSRWRSSIRATLVLVPDPGYPVYATWTRFVGGEVLYMPLRRDNGFLPDLDAIPADVAKRAKMMWINYPNNPTAALATRDFYARVVEFAQAARHHRRQRRRLLRGLLRGRAADLVPRDAGRQGRGHRVPVAVEDVQHDRLAHRLRRRQRRRWSAGSARSRPTPTRARSRRCRRRRWRRCRRRRSAVEKMRAIYQGAARGPVRRPAARRLRRARAEGDVLRARRLPEGADLGRLRVARCSTPAWWRRRRRASARPARATCG